MIHTTQEYRIGDCLELMQEYPDNHFDLILTDPPYGIGEADGKNITRGGRKGFGGKRGKYVASVDYGHKKWDNERIGEEYFIEMLRVSKNQIIFGGNYYTDYLTPSSCWIVWDKDINGDFADCELVWTSFKSAVRIIKYRWNGMLQENMKRKEKRVHPTQKPIALFEWILKKYANEGDLICDPFCGRGTMLAACRRVGMSGIGIEIEPSYEPLIRKCSMSDTPPLTAYEPERQAVLS